jgi:desulfoferrodoxin-like iron-binding protein
MNGDFRLGTSPCAGAGAPAAATHNTTTMEENVMPEVGKLYKCEICGNVVEVKEDGDGELVCCGEAMVKQ